jgi:hypothetical protein
MGAFQKIAMAVVALAFVGTLVASKNATVPVIGAFSKLSTGALSTAMGNSSGAIGGA